LPELANETVQPDFEKPFEDNGLGDLVEECAPANAGRRAMLYNRLIVLVGAVRFELTTTGTPSPFASFYNPLVKNQKCQAHCQMNSGKSLRKTLLVSKSRLEFGSFSGNDFRGYKPRSRGDHLPAKFNKLADALTPLRGNNS